ncbi:hypothetical protein NEOLEDRAFT_167677 [Neolentinus lepideus HHB14362 ss-1]|uniref:DUF6534 domain-containing protein n=1 Tax=Neolentinus lepideus HHB14362 ss-1 TaxID=1314782 RepID=A0A165TW87_9AGAM|nr:hypothetical protein NEOLEDRAFT_167677 [Neolentinus lepideus HHB14362 ss-1]
MTDLDLVLGPTLIGVLFNVFFFGCVATQAYIYFITFKTDHLRIRILVWFLLVMNTLNSGFECAVAYGYTITDFGNFEAASNGNWRAGTGPVLIGVIAATVQGFFAWRVYRLTRMTWFFVLICALIFVQFLGATGTGIAGSIIAPVAEWGRWQVKVPIVVWLVFAVTVDCLITFTLTFYLRRNRTGFVATDHIITRLIRVTVQTGMLTALWAVLDLVLYLALPTPVHLIFNLALPKLRSGQVITDTAWKDRPGESQAISGIHVTTIATIHREEFELTATKKAAEPAADDENTAGSAADLDLEANKRRNGEYALSWK